MFNVGPFVPVGIEGDLHMSWTDERIALLTRLWGEGKTAAEITREKLFKALYQELPYALMVETESWEEFDDGSVKISQVIIVQKESQKAIVVGKGGANIKKVGQEARLELEEIMERRVHLKLFAKVIENWAESAESYRAMGLDLPK